MLRVSALLGMTLVMVGCGPQSTSNTSSAGATDTSSAGATDTSSAGATDTGVTDTGATDTGATDTGATDTGATDTGVTDTGVTDTGATDTGVTDTGATDTGVTDTGVTDTGVTDTGATDTGASVVEFTYLMECPGASYDSSHECYMYASSREEERFWSEIFNHGLDAELQVFLDSAYSLIGWPVDAQVQGGGYLTLDELAQLGVVAVRPTAASSMAVAGSATLIGPKTSYYGMNTRNEQWVDIPSITGELVYLDTSGAEATCSWTINSLSLRHTHDDYAASTSSIWDKPKTYDDNVLQLASVDYVGCPAAFQIIDRLPLVTRGLSVFLGEPFTFEAGRFPVGGTPEVFEMTYSTSLRPGQSFIAYVKSFQPEFCAEICIGHEYNEKKKVAYLGESPTFLEWRAP